MTDDLGTALHVLADSGQPPAMDVERVKQAGRRGLIRRRKAAFGGGTAVLAVAGLAVAALAPAGSVGHRSATPTATTPAPATPTAMRTLAPAVDPHDPIITRYQFGYLPEGMHADGGMDAPIHRNQYSWSVTADSASGFQLSVVQATAEAATMAVTTVAGGASTRLPAVVPGATEAFWLGFGGTPVDTSQDGDIARLFWHLPSGEWLAMTASNLQADPDWKAQTLRAAATVIRQDRTVPLPIKISGGPLGKFDLSIVSVERPRGETVSHFMLVVPSEPPVDILAYDPRASELAKRTAPFGSNKTCKDSNGLTVCVNTTHIPPDGLTAIGGPQALLDRITSLGNDPANWTQDVLG